MGHSAKKAKAARPFEGRHVADLTARELADAGRRAGQAARAEAAAAGLTVGATRDGQPVWVRPDGTVEPTTWDQMGRGYPG